MRCGIGQDSHRFEVPCGTAPSAGDMDGSAADHAGGGKPLLLGGVPFPGEPGLEGNSDADVVLHALCNAISGVSGRNVLGAEADRMLGELGIANSEAYVRAALDGLEGFAVTHASFAIECARPRIEPRIDEMRANIARILGVGQTGVGITATSGEGLTAFGRGLGVQALCIVTCAPREPREPL